jgi:hypothetical protein
MIVLSERREAAMPAKRWPTIQEVLEHAREGLIDETTGTVRPTAEDRARIDADLEAFNAQRRARGRPGALPRRGAARRRTPT